MRLYFAYGANLNQANMAWRCADAVAVQPFYLQHWRLSFAAVATVQPCQGEQVPGALWAISDQDEAALDRFEAWPSLYRKQTVQQDNLEFMLYVMNSDAPQEPSAGYVLTIAQGYQDWGLDLADLDCAVQRTMQEQDQEIDTAVFTHSSWLREPAW